jgi:GT2 family glycosyltransferase
MSWSVASVTVSYNAAHLLPRQIEGLLAQSRPLQEIIVLDNASSDGTGALLAKRYPQVRVVSLAENAGAGGALAAGLAYAALEKRHDWIWMLDDDSVPDSNTVEALLDGAESLQDSGDEVGILAPMSIHRETGTPYPPLLWRDGWVKLSTEAMRQPTCFVDLVISSGSMVQRKVVEAIGLPRADFFMDFFDFEYCLRARSRGYRIAVITRAKLAHEMGNARKVRLPGFSGLWPDRAPWREYYMTRNLTYAVWWLYPNSNTKRFALHHLVRHAGGVLFFGSNKLACLGKMVQGFWDGRKASLGVRFRPS